MCGFVVGGVANVGVGLLVVFPAWVCGFDGGVASVGVGLMVVLPAWVWWMVCAANVGVVGFVFRWIWWLICVASVGVVEFRSGGFGVDLYCQCGC